MAGLEFSAPYNGDSETLEEILKLKRLGKNRIREIYLSGPEEYAGSGRVMPETDFDEFTDVVDKIHKEGIRVNLVFNSTCGGTEWYSPEGVKSTMEFIRQMHEEHGVEEVTIANPLFIMEVNRRIPAITIGASVLCDIDSVQKALIYRKAGAKVITPDVNINRDLKLLKEIKEATNLELKLMVNEGCLHKCPFRKFHFNDTSHQAKEVRELAMSTPYTAGFFDACNQVMHEDHSQILKSGWIRPEDTKKYSEITSFFKIVGRSQGMSKVIRTTKAYLEESWYGDLIDILCASSGRFTSRFGSYLNNQSLEKYKFFETITSCDNNCRQCNYCEELAGRLIKLGVLTREKLEDDGRTDVADKLGKAGRLPLIPSFNLIKDQGRGLKGEVPFQTRFK